MKKNTPTNLGFTLIEIIVSLALFIVVAVIAVGAFLKILDANKESQALETAMTNANFALDSMVRDLRVGEDYDCYNSAGGLSPGTISNEACPSTPYISKPGSSSPYPTIAFYSSQSPANWNCSNPPIHAYRYNPTVSSTTPDGELEKSEQTVCSDTDIGDASSPFVQLTASTFAIQSFGISVDVSGQPKAFIFMQATAGSNLQNETVFTVQTTASQRIMNQ
jgi:type II secretory pathway pseudopilin PulG